MRRLSPHLYRSDAHARRDEGSDRLKRPPDQTDPRRTNAAREHSARAQPVADAALQLTLPLFDLPPAAPPAPVRAPAGMRSTMLCEQPVHYELRRSRRRTIGFVIDDRGLRVTAPRWVPMGEIERALQEKRAGSCASWSRRAHEARRERVAIRWHDGATLRFLARAHAVGRPRRARIARRRRAARGLPRGEEQLRDRSLAAGARAKSSPSVSRCSPSGWVVRRADGRCRRRARAGAVARRTGPSG